MNKILSWNDIKNSNNNISWRNFMWMNLLVIFMLVVVVVVRSRKFSLTENQWRSHNFLSREQKKSLNDF